MNKIVLGIFAVTLYFAVGQALQCYECKVGLWDLCFTTKQPCGNNEHCYSGVGKAGGFVDIKKKGCLEVAKCNNTEKVHFPTNGSTIYHMTKTCCSTDLCNSAPGHFHVSAVSMAFATISSVFMVKFLI
ncbi:sperm acrosome membrane-associated protein 4 [Onychostoma macrolepis]|uniref:UPAR/Ly6 domain-containing protein n=1 Tax=Onychostoma macrolepis TaxID=369639 RepID=A0A7J6BYL6_9TELE|nr:sperm acrosome membrane-associated protein 4 [Onychostoma macrolepis]KAF4100050.1 hypothetical protein G5714_018246 [Onychostoma macrolepis]